VRRSDQRRAAVVALYQRDVTGRPLNELVDREATPFTRELVEGVASNETDLDGLIERYSQGWTLDRIAPLERSIMRVALYELLHRDDIPDEVAIDEAVESAKELCGAEAPGFVNGILGAVHRERASA
jgi:transcription antitermination protein NusB